MALALDELEKTWIADFDDPTRLVLVGHSHGTVWASLLAWNFPHVTFDYLVYLDGVCRFWWGDHERYFVGAFDAYGYRRPFPLNADESGESCKSLAVPGLSAQDLEDVVPDNVLVGLEVQAGVFSVPQDAEPNHRPSGGRADIYTLVSDNLHHGGDAVHVRGTGAMKWVAEAIKTLGVFDNQSDLEALGRLELERLVPAPEGFRYFGDR